MPLAILNRCALIAPATDYQLGPIMWAFHKTLKHLDSECSRSCCFLIGTGGFTICQISKLKHGRLWHNMSERIEFVVNSWMFKEATALEMKNRHLHIQEIGTYNYIANVYIKYHNKIMVPHSHRGPIHSHILIFMKKEGLS